MSKQNCGACKHWARTGELTDMGGKQYFVEADLSSRKECRILRKVVHGDDACDQWERHYFCADCMRPDEHAELQECGGCHRIWCTDCESTCSMCGGALELL